MTLTLTIERDPDQRVAAWLARVAAEPATGEAPVLVVESLGGEGGGEALATVLASRTGFDAWDGALVDAILTRAELVARIRGALDEAQRQALDALVASAVRADAEPAVVARLSLAAALAAHGRAILVELGAHHLLPAERALRVYLAPPFDRAVEHRAAQHGLEVDAVRAELAARRDALEAAARRTFGRGATDADGFDLVLNSATLDLFNAVEVVIAAYQGKFRPPPGWWYG